MEVVYFQRNSEFASIRKVFDNVAKNLGAEFRPRVVISRYRSLGLFRRLYNIIEAALRQGDINHVTGDVHFLTFLMSRRKTLLTVHDCILLEQTQGAKKRLAWFIWFWLPAKRVAVVTTVSDHTKRELIRHGVCPPEKIRVVHNPLPDEFVSAPAEFRSDRPVVLQIGTTPNKNLERLAEALNGLGCRLRIVGKPLPLQREELKRNGIEISTIDGCTDEQIVDEYRNADLVSFASTYEGFGLPIIEAQAIGRPVVTSRIPPMTEVAGEGAALVDPHDPRSIREAIERIIRDPEHRQRLISAGHENVKRFRPQEVVAKYEAIYLELASKP